MEKTFTIFNKKIQYKKESRCFYYILGHQGRRRERFVHSYPPKIFISRILFFGVQMKLYHSPESTWKNISHTCRNRELKRILEKFLQVAFEMVQVGGLTKYLQQLQQRSAKVYMKHWKLPADLLEVVLEFLPEPDLAESMNELPDLDQSPY
jgi:hypothetical protein